ncbi:OmpA family protein [Pacificibacter marinus]|uniref:Outer membrane porin F n=2 Tax=Pacificibacter marinus TaxID=658057 RepID=A0A1Y5SEV2_9RHOB|nr:OmpA family protein [Pacificibacter marinus]SEK54128.1 OmpA family protein [Pacificibacter marinus]SLN39183.1 Outer membrane porin F precursor [Pacificibacter marinus]
MTNELLSKARATLAGSLVAAMAFAGSAAHAQTISGGESYEPTIWIDPDGCEHWVMDDGIEGYMDLKVDRQGMPTCHPVQTCAVMNSDQLFGTGRSAISATGRKHLADFFATAGATAYTIIGHTDSRGSDEYNMKLSANRANTVAGIAKQAGVRVADVRGYGERMPIASNATAAGMQKNRRVEIICIK